MIMLAKGHTQVDGVTLSPGWWAKLGRRLAGPFSTRSMAATVIRRWIDSESPPLRSDDVRRR